MDEGKPVSLGHIASPLLLANLVTTSKALVTRSDALVTTIVALVTRIRL